MSQVWVPRLLQATPATVYYPEFWYSAHFGLKQSEYSIRYIEQHVERHKENLRLLSLLFVHLYVPRTHLITHFHEVTDEISEQTLASPEYKYFRGIEFVHSSYYPGLDAQSDVERIATRVSAFKWLYHGHLPRIDSRLDGTKSVRVDSLKEATSNVASFSTAARVIRMFDAKAASTYSEIVKGAHTTNVPFFHERFLSDLFRRLDADTADRLWKETNSIYLLSGLPGAMDAISYFSDRYESEKRGQVHFPACDSVRGRPRGLGTAARCVRASTWRWSLWLP